MKQKLYLGWNGYYWRIHCYTRLLVKIEMMKERFSKLLHGEDLVMGMVFVLLWLSRFQLQIYVWWWLIS
ncbi:hypothetical protein L1987_17590 [Smallanthus sonchifolius]|uniref:Uncharacterized protein n=1 Tax=Smallanthus sonchifolius TaxID=185202 RepID=A0ACB9J0T9_9ASTR|nr:hypothetical protein L1987_17590 [Smallanthus sonchifolius]